MSLKIMLRSLMLMGLLAFLVTTQAGSVRAGTDVWTSIGPDGGTILSLAIDPQNPARLFAGTFLGGVFKSEDGGGNWQATKYITGMSFSALAINPANPNIIYAVPDKGIYKTENGGEWWSYTSLANNPDIVSIVIDPNNPSTVYLGGTTSGDFGVYKSTDGGETWEVAVIIHSGYVSAELSNLIIDPLTSTTLYVGTSQGVFKSVDGGMNWFESNTGLPLCDAGQRICIISSLAIDPQTSSTLYAGTEKQGVYKSTDSGGTWEAASNGLTNERVTALVIDPKVTSTLYAGSYSQGVFKSINSGGSWEVVYGPLTDPYDSVHLISIDPLTPSTLYFSTYGQSGVFKSTDSGGNWEPVIQGLSNTFVYSLAIDPQTPSTLYANNSDEGLFKSTDGGEKWHLTGLTEKQVDSLVIDPLTSSTIYAITFNAELYKSTDSGGNWILSNTGFVNGVDTLAIDPATPSTLYCGTGIGVIKSTDGGDTWNLSSTGLSAGFINSIAVDPQTPATLYAATDGGVFKSTNSGGNWEKKSTGLPEIRASLLLVDPITPEILFAVLWEYRGIYKSMDGGENWSTASNGLSSGSFIYAMTIDPQTPNILYAGGTDYGGTGLYRTTDGGENWLPFNSGLYYYANVYSLAINPQNPTNLYAGTGGSGVYVIGDIEPPAYDYDIGFRPFPDGYKFSNWNPLSSPPSWEDFSIDDVRKMFGDSAVCSTLIGSTCIPKTSAFEWWMNIKLLQLPWGGCNGYSTTSLRFFYEFDKPEDFQSGAGTTHNLEIANIRSHIAYYQALQFPNPVASTEVEMRKLTPKQVLAQLQSAMSAGAPDPMVLNIYYDTGVLPRYTFGHTVVPYALEDRSNDIWWVWVYDPNYEDDANRYLIINTKFDTWNYADSIFGGDATTHSLYAVPISIYAEQPECPWCETTAVEQLSLYGQGHLLITDSQGRRIGYAGSQFVEEIPGAFAKGILADGGTPSEPVYYLPITETYTILLDGQTLSQPQAAQGESSSISLFGPGYAATVDGLMVSSTSADSVQVAADGKQMEYESGGSGAVTLSLMLDGAGESSEFQVGGADIPSGQTVRIADNPDTHQFVFDNSQADSIIYDLKIKLVDSSGEHIFMHQGIPILASDTYYSSYGTWDGGMGGMELLIDHGSDGSIDETVVLDNQVFRVFLPMISR